MNKITEPINLLSKEMKKMKFFALMAVAAVALSCTNEPETILGGQKVKLTFDAESVSRVWIDSANSPEGAYDFKLSGNEKLAISYNGGYEVVTLNNDNSVIMEVIDDGSGSHQFIVMNEDHSNSNGVSSYDNATGLATVTVPHIQTRSTVEGQKTPNRQAIFLYGATETTASLPEELHVTLRHATAYGKLDVLNFKLGEGETLQQVQIVADTPISGIFKFNPTTGEWGDATSPRYAINMKVDDLEDLWFGCLPNEAVSTLEVLIQTNKCIYTKTIDFSKVANPLKFRAGEVSRFKVDMSNALSQVVTEDADAFNPDPNDKYFIVLSSESGNPNQPSGNFAVRNTTTSRSPIACKFPTVAHMGVDKFLWKIVKNVDGTFTFISLDPANYTNPETPVIEYLWLSNGNAQGYCVQPEAATGETFGGYYASEANGSKTYQNTFRLFRNTDEKYPDSFYMSTPHNITATRVNCVAYPYFNSTTNGHSVSLRGVHTGEGQTNDPNDLRVRFLKYTGNIHNNYWTLPEGVEDGEYMIIVDHVDGDKLYGALSHTVTTGYATSSENNKMVLDLFETGSANGLESYVRPTSVDPFVQGTLTTNENFDASKYTWTIKRDALKPGTYKISYKDEKGKEHFLSQNAAGTALLVDNTNAVYSQNFKFVSFYNDDGKEFFGIAVDAKKKVTGSDPAEYYYTGTYRYIGSYKTDSGHYDVRSISAPGSVNSNIFLHKVE